MSHAKHLEQAVGANILYMPSEKRCDKKAGQYICIQDVSRKHATISSLCGLSVSGLCVTNLVEL